MSAECSGYTDGIMLRIDNQTSFTFRLNAILVSVASPPQQRDSPSDPTIDSGKQRPHAAFMQSAPSGPSLATAFGNWTAAPTAGPWSHPWTCPWFHVPMEPCLREDHNLVQEGMSHPFTFGETLLADQKGSETAKLQTMERVSRWYHRQLSTIWRQG